MKKKIFNFLLLIVFILSVSSCEKKYETSDLSTITYYPEFTFNGEEVIAFAQGSTYDDPGVTAEENGTEIPVTLAVSGIFRGFSGDAVDMATPDKYEITYSAVNSDGYTGYQYRTVWVANTGDLVSSIEGLYSSTIVRNGVVDANYQDLQYVLIWKEGSTYYISDAIGGYYDMGRGYGIDYAAQGMTITANDIPTNDFTFGGPIGVGAFGGSLVMDYMTVDAGTKTIVFQSTWSYGYVFVVTLTQVSI